MQQIAQLVGVVGVTVDIAHIHIPVTLHLISLQHLATQPEALTLQVVAEQKSLGGRALAQAYTIHLLKFELWNPFVKIMKSVPPDLNFEIYFYVTHGMIEVA